MVSWGWMIKIDENYRVINIIFKIYGNLPLCLDNYALFLLPPIFKNKLYTYTFRNIIYLGEPSGNFNLKLTWHIYTHNHACILSYLPKENFQTVFSMIHGGKYVSQANTFSIHIQNTLTLIPVMIQQVNKFVHKTYKFLLVF